MMPYYDDDLPKMIAISWKDRSVFWASANSSLRRQERRNRLDFVVERILLVACGLESRHRVSGSMEFCATNRRTPLPESAWKSQSTTTQAVAFIFSTNASEPSLVVKTLLPCRIYVNKHRWIIHRWIEKTYVGYHASTPTLVDSMVP